MAKATPDIRDELLAVLSDEYKNAGPAVPAGFDWSILIDVGLELLKGCLDKRSAAQVAAEAKNPTMWARVMMRQSVRQYLASIDDRPGQWRRHDGDRILAAFIAAGKKATAEKLERLRLVA